MRVDHGGRDIRMTQQLLNSANVVPRLEQMCGEGVPHGMAADALMNSGRQCCTTNCLLHAGFMQMMPTNRF
jgi:hypothetical protein